MKMPIVTARIALGLVVVTAVSGLPGRARAAPPELGPPAATEAPATPPPPSPPSPEATAPVPVTAPALPVALPPPPESPSVQRRTVALVAAGVAVVGAGVGTAFGVLALQNKSDYGKNPTYANSDKGNNDAAYADGAIALAVAAGVTSLVLFLTAEPAHDGSPSSAARTKATAGVSASPMITTHGGGADLVLRF